MNIQKEMGIHHTLEDYFQKVLHDYYAQKDPVLGIQIILRYSMKYTFNYYNEKRRRSSN